tara:strand:+ start:176 stop:343 length:168 start_codon:yes stop_codon:yes gene_type:complete
MHLKVKLNITLQIDPEEYPVPADGNVGEEIQDYIKDTLHDLEGVQIRHMKTISEE